MKKRTILVIAIVIILAVIVTPLLYNYWLKPGKVEQAQTSALKPVALKIMTTWSQWTIDDFKRYFFAESGMPRAGVVLPSAAMVLNITNITFIYVEDPKIWKKAGFNGSIDGFVGQNRYNITTLCYEGALHPIENPEIIKLAKNVPDVFKGYTKDGKLCWVAMYFVPYTWLVNLDYANKMGIGVPSTWSDLLKPEYLSVITRGGYLMAVYPVPNRAPMVNSVNTILARYGWEKGWAIIAVVMGAASRFETSSKAASDSVSFGRALLTTLEFSTAYTAYSMFPDKLSIEFPKNETGFWFTPIAIAANVSKDGLDGMYRLIKWVLTDMQDKMLLNRTGWSFNMPVLGFNNTNPRIIYKEKAVQNLFTPPIDLEFALGEASPAITLYADILVSDRDVRNILKDIVTRLIEKYTSNQISTEEYYQYIWMIGQPPKFKDPATGEIKAFSLDEARQISNAIRNGIVKEDNLRTELKNAIISNLNTILQELG
ncbi:MAG: extracellular solute-binding protein [Ignisphaera sp.]